MSDEHELNLAEIEARGRAVDAVMKKPYWTPEDVALVIGRAPSYVRLLMRQGKIKRVRHNLTTKALVDEYMGKVQKGRYRSEIR